MEAALRNAHAANALLIDENKRLETAVGSLQSYQKVLQDDKRIAEQTSETLAISHREARAEILVLKEGFRTLELAQATSTPVGEVLGAIGPAESPIPIVPASTTPVTPVPLTPFQLEINRIRQILDDNGVAIADFERIRAGHWIMFRSQNALMGFVPQTTGPESSRLGEWDDYQSHLILVLRMWRNRWPTSIVGPLPEFIEPLLQTLERKDPMITRPQYSAAQGTPGVSPSTPTNPIPVGRGRGNPLKELLASEERRLRSHQLNLQHMALKDIQFQPAPLRADPTIDVIEIGDDDGVDEENAKVSSPVSIKTEPGAQALVPTILSPLALKKEPEDEEMLSVGGEVPSTSTQTTEDVDVTVDVLIGNIKSLLGDEIIHSAPVSADDSEDEAMDTQATNTVDLAIQSSVEELALEIPDPEVSLETPDKESSSKTPDPDLE
jgi:hypothetical protein